MRRVAVRYAAVCLLLCVLFMTSGCEQLEELFAEPSPVPTATPAPSPTPTVEPSPTPTAEPTPSPVPTPTPLPVWEGLLGWEYADRFCFTDYVSTKTEFRTDAVSITVTEYKEQKSVYSGSSLVSYVADIYVRDASLIRRGYTEGGFENGVHRSAVKIAATLNAVLAISGDYVTKGQDGFLIRDGEIILDSGEYKRDIAVLYRDGSMKTYAPEEIDPEAIMTGDPWQSWCFGPSLLDENGQVKESYNIVFNTDGKNPRCAIGYYEPGHYCFVVVDGRQKGYSMGVSIKGLAELMRDLGCRSAYNLDGGLTAQMVFQGKRVNSPPSNRSLIEMTYVECPPICVG